ncbi:MAG: ATP-binding protein [Melioribacteraceae bacterium]|nr:ATP-binding protein [Melioribacteraceae bacterium]
MIINLSIKNFRSIKDTVSISFLESSKKEDEKFKDNSREVANYKILTSSIVYGRNASGKSNILLALQAIAYLLRKSDSFKSGETIEPYEPFLFDEYTKKKEVEFEIVFIGSNKKKYSYSMKYLNDKFTYESLYFYPKGVSSKLFERENDNFSFGEYYKGERSKIVKSIIENQLYLSKAASNKIEHLNIAYEFLTQELIVPGLTDSELDKTLLYAFSEFVNNDANNMLLNNMKKILLAADTNIIDFKISKNDDSKFNFPDNMPKELQEKLKNDYMYDVTTFHNSFRDGEKVGLQGLELEKESLGTRKLMALGGMLLPVLALGGVVVIDELDKSLHPLLTKMIINLFHSKKNNPHNAQLIFATHDSSLLDSDLFRRDQIIFVDKEYEGNTTTYKLSDIKGVRPDVPFDKWYLSGRFSAIPVIDNDIELENETVR